MTNTEKLAALREFVESLAAVDGPHTRPVCVCCEAEKLLAKLDAPLVGAKEYIAKLDADRGA